MSELRVVSVTVKDVLGAEEFAMEPGKVTLLAGENGSGKSTALAAVQAALSGGNLAKLAHVHADGRESEPEVVLVIQGPGHEAYEVKRKGDKLRVRERVGESAAFADIGKPQAWLSTLFDPDGCNPVKFLLAKDDERVKLLLAAVPLKFDRAALLADMGIQAAELPPIPAGVLHPLEETAAIRKAVFEKRTGVNRDQKGKASAAEQTKRNAPAVIPEDHDERRKKLQAERDALGEEIAADRRGAAAAEEQAIAAARHAHELAEQEVTASFKQAAAKLRGDHDREAAAIRAEAERRISDLAGVLETTISGLRESDEATLAKADETMNAALDAARKARETADTARQEKQARLNSMDQQLGVLAREAEGAHKARALHEQAQQFEDESKALLVESERLTAAIDALDAYARRMAEDLPIPGLSIEGGDIRVDGVPYSQLNQAQRIAIAVKVAALRSEGRRLKVIFVDGAEALDSKRFAILSEEIEKHGLQAFIARVTDDPMQVVADPEPVGAGAL